MLRKILFLIIMLPIPHLKVVPETSTLASGRTGKHQFILEKKMLIGKWRSTEDRKSVLSFHMYYCLSIYDKRIIDTSYFVLSKTCEFKDSLSSIDLDNAYLLFISRDSTYQECNEMLNLSKYVLSIRNEKNAKIHVYDKIKQ
jgi:hypothetical protein